MLIGMRNAMLAGGGWKNPYVTDGLVAMWDGEWNAGGGVHDNEIRCINLCGTSETLVPSGGLDAYSIGSDSIIKNDKNDGLVATFTQGYLDSWLIGDGTCEIVFSAFSSSGGVYYDVATGENYGKRGLRVSGMGNGGNKVVNAIEYRIDNYAIYYKSSSVGIYDRRYYVSSITQGSTRRVSTYEDGMALSPITGGSIASGFANVLKILRFKDGEFCTFRFYSRALTADEIAANYAVDKARFSLPDAT